MELTIYGEIGYWPNDLGTIRNVLKKVSDTEDIILRVNSPGGGVIEGFAIANMLERMPNKIVAYIDGWAASMASILVMVADEIHAPENAWMMIHRPWVGVAGDADEMRKMADILDEMGKQSIDMYMRKANISRDELTKLIYDETWLSAQAAYDIGLVTHLEASIEMAACWDVENRPHNAPAAAVAAITPKGASQMNLMEWLKDKFAASENVEDVFSELADAEKFAAMVGEIDAFKAQVAAVEAERDEAKAEVEQLRAAKSEIEASLAATIAEITARAAEAEEAKAELQAKHDALMGGMKKPEDKPAAKGSKYPATSHYMELVKQLTEELGDVEAATIQAKTKYAEDFAAMLAEHPSRKEA